MGLLESCADTYAANNLSFSDILQEPSIEDHPAIYWAIVKRPSPDDFELITSLMSYLAPLTTETMTKVRSGVWMWETRRCFSVCGGHLSMER